MRGATLGGWNELTRKVQRGISGHGSRGHIKANVRGQAVSADIAVATHGAQQTVDIGTASGNLSMVSIVLRRGGLDRFPEYARALAGDRTERAADDRHPPSIAARAARRYGEAAQRQGEPSVSNAKSSREPPRSRPSTRALAIAIASIALAGLAIWIVATPARNPSVLVGGPFALQTGDGATLTDVDLKGHPFLVYFGYTHCPDVCPTTLAEISDVLRRMPDKPIRALFVTVDPERDTAASMADYVSSFDSRIVGLSGSRAEIDAIEKAYRVYARKGPPRADGGYSIDHSSVVYLMDAKGAFVEALDLERPPEEAAKELSAYF